MKNKNFIFNNKLSHEYHLVFDIDGAELSNDIKDVLVDFEDVTLPMKRFGSYLPGEVFIKNFDKIYNHIQNIDTVFKVGRTGDIGKGFTPPCVRPIGVMANEYLDYGSSSINKFEVDYKMYDQYVIGHSFVPGVYKMTCNGKPATMLIKYNPNGVIKQRGVVFYNDDITVDDNLRQYIK